LHIKDDRDASEAIDFYVALSSMFSKWMDIHVGVQTDVNFPDAYVSSNGRYLLDIITSLTGYRPGGISTTSLG
jgi:hypothetical protein